MTSRYHTLRLNCCYRFGCDRFLEMEGDTPFTEDDIEKKLEEEEWEYEDEVTQYCDTHKEILEEQANFDRHVDEQIDELKESA